MSACRMGTVVQVYTDAKPRVPAWPVPMSVFEYEFVFGPFIGSHERYP